MLWLFIPVKGIPYDVTVFATNGRGCGLNVRKITYAEQDGKYYCHMLLSNATITILILQFRGLQEI